MRVNILYEPVVMMADLMAYGLREGFRALMVAAIPDTCGHDIEVPDNTLNGGLPLPGLTDASFPIHAAIIFTPGAVTSGCNQ